MGRPTLAARREARIDVRLDPELRRAIRVAAAEDDMALGEWLAEAAREKLARRARQRMARSGESS